MATEIGLPEAMKRLGMSASAAEEDSASCAICKIYVDKEMDSASRAAASRTVASRVAVLSRARCENCSAKMLSSSKIKATGGKSIKAAGKENEAKPAEIVKAASSNKMKAVGPVGSASRAVAQVWREKPASTELIRKAAYEWLNKCGKPVKEDPASRPCCKVCKIVGEICDDMQVVTGCKICVAKAAALNRIKATGGDIIKAVEEGKAKPAGLVKASSLAQKDVMKTVTENREGKLVTIVTVRVPYADTIKVMHLPPRSPLRPLPQDFLKKSPVILEATRACAAETLNSIKTQENALAQFFEMGYSTLELQVVDG